MAVKVKFESHVKEALAELAQNKRDALDEIGATASGYAFWLSPHDTGRLRNSINHRVIDDNTVAVGTNVEYAAYQEFGTSKYIGANGGKGYLRPAVKEHMNEYRDIVKEFLKA